MEQTAVPLKLSTCFAEEKNLRIPFGTIFLGREKPSEFHSEPFLIREIPSEFCFKPFLDEKIS
jgi:hypothetical protein